MSTTLNKICKNHGITPRVAEQSIIQDHMFKNKMHGRLVTIHLDLPTDVLKVLRAKAKVLHISLNALLTGILLDSLDRPKEYFQFFKKAKVKGVTYSEDREA